MVHPIEKLVAVSVFAFAFAGWAGWDPETETYDTTGYIQMKTGDSGNTSSFHTGTNWDSQAPTAEGSKYYVQSKMQVRLLASGDNDASIPFKGDVLAVSGTLSGPCTKVHIPYLDLLAGSTVCLYTTPITYENATIGVYPNMNNPADYVRIDHGVAGSNNKDREPRGWVFNNVKLVGPEKAHIYFDNSRSNSVGYVNFKSGCDVSEYFGKITLASRPEFLHDAGGGASFAGVKFGPDFTGFPGTIILGTNSVLDVTNVTESAIATSKLEINNLTALSGAEFRVANGASDTRTISVTNAFTHNEGPVNLVFDKFDSAYRTAGFTPRSNLVPFRVKVAEGDAGAEPSFLVSDFTIPDYGDTMGLPRFTWSVKRADGWDSLACEGRPVVVKTSKDDPEDVTSVTNALAWSDERLPHFGADYYLGSAIRIFDDPSVWGENGAYKSKDPRHVSKTYVWQGDSLTLGKCNMQIKGINGMFVTNMTIAAGSVLTMYGAKFRVYTVNPVRLVPAAGSYASFYVYNSAEIHVENGIEGSGDVWCEFRGKNFPDGFVEFCGANTNFTGKVLLACKDFTKPTSADYTPRETNRVEVIVSDGRNLGGALPAFAYDALRIRDWSLLKVTNTTAFAETTRGVFVDWMGCISVADGKTASFAAPFTFGGVLKKQGPGTLALGGTAPKFATGTLNNYTIGDEPVEGTNVVNVAEGAIKPLSAAAFDGLELRFAENAMLKVDVDPADADLKAKGLVNVKWATPFVAPAGGQIAVGFDAPDENVRGEYEVAVCTVPKAAVAAPADLKAMFRAVRPRIGGHRYSVTTEVVENDDETLTLKAKLCRSGLMVLVK